MLILVLHTSMVSGILPGQLGVCPKAEHTLIPCQCCFGHKHDLIIACLQVLFHIYEDAELKPLLDAVNDEREKEKEKENES